MLAANEYCVVVNPVVGGRVNLGGRELRVGPCVFFPQPQEKPQKVEVVVVLNEDEALYVRATERFRDEFGWQRRPGDRWLVCGPLKYVPPLEVEGERRGRVCCGAVLCDLKRICGFFVSFLRILWAKPHSLPQSLRRGSRYFTWKATLPSASSPGHPSPSCCCLSLSFSLSFPASSPDRERNRFIYINHFSSLSRRGGPLDDNKIYIVSYKPLPFDHPNPLTLPSNHQLPPSTTCIRTHTRCPNFLPFARDMRQ